MNGKTRDSTYVEIERRKQRLTYDPHSGDSNYDTGERVEHDVVPNRHFNWFISFVYRDTLRNQNIQLLKTLHLDK